MIKEAIAKLSIKENLTYDESKQCVNEIMSGEVSPVLISSFLTALAMKGETEDEIAGAAQGMREKATLLNSEKEVLDIVGTGGDRSNTFNISTTASIIIAAAGVNVAKHGNRAASSKSGAADCLEALGVNISNEDMKKVLDETGICFMFAQKYHSAMKYVGPVRKEIGIRTVFNLLGPLTNPALAKMMVLGVFSEEYVEKIAKSLVKLGIKRALVVHGKDKLDEISACGETAVAEVNGEDIIYYTITPEDFGYQRCSKADLLGGTPEENARITRDILSGKERGAKRTAVVMNAGAGIYVANPELGLRGAMKIAEEIIDSGKACEKLNEFIRCTNGD